MNESTPKGDSSVDVETRRIVYNDSVARWFVGASVVWGIVGMLVGAVIALQLAFWHANLPPYFTYGRLRPLHTNAVIFAFVGNMVFAGIYYSTQRLVKARLPSDLLAKIHFWGWQLIIVAAAITLPLGLTQGKEYAELEWPIDIAIAARVGRVRDQVLLDSRAPNREAPVRRHLVLHRDDRDRRGPTHRQFARDPCIRAQELLHLRGRAKTRSCSGGTATTPSHSS